VDLNNLLHDIKRSSTELMEIIAEAKRNNELREEALSRSIRHLENLYKIIDKLYLYCIKREG